MSIKNLYPTQRPEIIYNVINGRNELPVNSTFSRAGVATYVGGDGLLRTADIDEPRFDYDPETGEFKGLLLEATTYNTVKESEKLSRCKTSGAGNQYEYTEFDEGGALGAGFMRVKCKEGFEGIHLWPLTLVFTEPGEVKNTPMVLSYWARSHDSSVTFIRWSNVDTEPIYNRVVTSEWKKFYYYFSYGAGQTTGGELRCFRWPNEFVPGQSFDICLAQIEPVNSNPLGTSFIKTPDDGAVNYLYREPDAFSLLSSRNFDAGFSLLLDSQTTTKDFIYKIKADGTEIASLTNDGGTLDWTINGKSAAINGEYPQVGFLPGRVRTISSFGPAGQGDVENYLYTTGLSFPTTAEPAAGADEIEFGVPQTLKALYGWQGQLNETNAVSLIKGKYNVVPNKPITADALSFVYNTDPANEGKTLIELPANIVPTISMIVDWGDGNSNAYEKGVTPEHTYPYPGQYRIQIEADDGFDKASLSDTTDTITKVDQWAPQHRVGSTGTGYTGDDLYFFLYFQRELTNIPPFKYSGLTDLTAAFHSLRQLNVNRWDWVPWNIPEVTSLSGTYYQCGYNTIGSSGDSRTFPQLVTGPDLTNISQIFYDSGIRGWVEKTNGDAPTNKPFTDTSNVTNWDYAFYNCQLDSLVVDTRSATSMVATFYNNYFTEFPFIDTGSVTKMPQCFQSNQNITSFPQIDTSNCTNFFATWFQCFNLETFPQLNTSNAETFASAWKECKALTAFPQIDSSNVSNFNSAWMDCIAMTDFPTINTSGGDDFNSTWRGMTSLETFPLLDTSSGVVFSYAWYNCNKLTSFPLIDTSSAQQFNQTWQYCSGLTSFPELNTSNSTQFPYAWRTCPNLAAFPAIDTSKGVNFYSSWAECTSLTAFPALNFSSATDFRYAWQSCSSLADFPANMFDDTGELYFEAFVAAWAGCALTAASIENILVSLDANGSTDIALGIQDGTNAAKGDWTEAANTAFDNLIAKGWSITYNE